MDDFKTTTGYHIYKKIADLIEDRKELDRAVNEVERDSLPYRILKNAYEEKDLKLNSELDRKYYL